MKTKLTKLYVELPPALVQAVKDFAKADRRTIQATVEILLEAGLKEKSK